METEEWVGKTQMPCAGCVVVDVGADWEGDVVVGAVEKPLAAILTKKTVKQQQCHHGTGSVDLDGYAGHIAETRLGIRVGCCCCLMP